jgi:hypothetical protein
MRNLNKMLKNYQNDLKDYDSIWERIYLSDWFDPVYRAIRFIPNLISDIRKYHYYGKIGMGVHDFDYDPYTMQAAHISRVKDFMLSDNTHLMWNDNAANNRMRKLLEASGLLNQLKAGRNYDINYVGKFLDKYSKKDRQPNCLDGLFDDGRNRKPIRNELYDFFFKKAAEKDDAIMKGKKERLHYLVEKYGDQWWD